MTRKLIEYSITKDMRKKNNLFLPFKYVLGNNKCIIMNINIVGMTYNFIPL